MDTPNLRSNSYIGHSQPQTDHTVSVDTLQPQTDQTVPVDILKLELISHIGLLTTSDWLHIHVGPPASYWGDSPNAFYNFRLIRYSQWTPPVSDWSESRSRQPVHLNWSDIHSGHSHPRTDQAVPVPCNLRLIRQSQRTHHNLRLISRPGGHTKTSDQTFTVDTLKPPTDQTVPADTPQPQTDQQTRWTH